MAKTQTYSDDILIKAVEKYAKEYSGKIMATKLAEWAKEHIQGLEGVHDYNFVRPSVINDPKTKKKKHEKRLCTMRIEEINKTRTTAAGISTNILLKSSNIDDFFRLSTSEQRKYILSTREQMDSLVARNLYLERENNVIHAENNRLSILENELDANLDEISKTEKNLKKKVNQIITVIDGSQRRDVLASIGISDDGFNLKKNTDSLSIAIKEAFSISDVIKGRIKATQVSNDLTCSVIEGIDF